MPSSAYTALKIRDFRLFLAMRLFTTLSIQIMSVSVGYYVYDLSGDALMLGLLGLSEALPAIGVSLYAGHLADKLNRKHILMFCLSLLSCCALGLWALVWRQEHYTQTALLGGIYSIIFLTGIGRGFFSPTNFSFMPQLVSREALPNAITWNSSAWQVSSVSGLGIGGLLYGFAGPHTAFAVMSLLCLSALVCLMMIPSRPAAVSDPLEPPLKRIREGLRFVKDNKLVLGAIALDLFAVLFGGAVALLPVYAKDILHVGPEGLGVLRAAMSLGAILMAFVLAHRQPGRRAGRIMLACVAGFGLCMIGFGLSTWFWLSFAFLFLAGVFDEVSVFIRSSLIQYLTPDRMKGRVSSVNAMFITSSNEIGAFESGVAARLMGTVPSVVFGGVMTLLIVAIAWRKAPQLRDLDYNALRQTEA